jgi:3-phenylpropionate/trans-cinnamate dioxygenase ferredoxin subunit
VSDWTPVAPLAQLTPGTRRRVYLDEVAVTVFNVAGTLYAVEDLCTHDGSALGDGLLEGTEIICPRHGARFCLKTGAALAPPAYEPIARFEVRVNGEMVEVRDPRRD